MQVWHGEQRRTRHWPCEETHGVLEQFSICQRPIGEEVFRGTQTCGVNGRTRQSMPDLSQQVMPSNVERDQIRIGAFGHVERRRLRHVDGQWRR